MEERKTLVVGIGEVGAALAKVIERSAPVLRHDVKPRHFKETIGVMHICFPFKDKEGFVSTAASYVARFRPAMTIVNSTVLPGTTRAIAEATGCPVAYSPVRGKHARMVEDLLSYPKYVAASDNDTAERAQKHFRRAGFKTRRMKRLETLELAKLAETTYFGVLIAFAQELNRWAERVGAEYEEAIDFFEDIPFLPAWRYFPGFIGGHCVIPNIHILLTMGPSSVLEAVLDSNRRRAAEIESQALRQSSG